MKRKAPESANLDTMTLSQRVGHVLNHSFDGEFDIFQNITAADVQRVARTYFTPENRLVLTILPSSDGSGGAR